MFLRTYVRITDAVGRIPGAARKFSADQSGQDAFEYLLVIGGVSVAVIIAMATPVGTTLASKVVAGTCAAVATAVPSVTC